MGNNMTCLHTFKIIYICKGATYPCTSCNEPFKITCRLRQTRVRSNTIDHTNDNIGVTLFTIFYKVLSSIVWFFAPKLSYSRVQYCFLYWTWRIIPWFHHYILSICHSMDPMSSVEVGPVHILLRPWMKALHSILTTSATLMHTV